VASDVRAGTIANPAASWRAINLAALWAAAFLILAQLGSCPSVDIFGPRTAPSAGTAAGDGTLPLVEGQVIGNGPVRVALLLPLTGTEGLAEVAASMRNSASLAMQTIAQSEGIEENIHLVIKDTAGNTSRTRQVASEALAEGASLILGPLRAENVRAAGTVAQARGVPLIGFSNNPGVAAPGVYLLNVLPESEVQRSVAYATGLGRRSFAAVIPRSAFGEIQQAAFAVATSQQTVTVNALYQFTTQEDAEQAVVQLAPFLLSGAIDTVFLPDRATAPSIAALLQGAGVDKNAITILGSQDWDGDATIMQTPFLAGAYFPAPDPTGYERLRSEYVAAFGSDPHPLSTFAYTAVLLANTTALATAVPRYDRALLTRESGFQGRDGVFRFLDNGTNQHALVIKQVTIGGDQVVDAAKMPVTGGGLQPVQQ
jgi:branched-chain amino acid transport system substrate-binding protein